MSKKSEEEDDGESEKESELEEEIEETEKNIDENKFIEFLQISTKPSAPVLEKIQNAQEISTLEQDIISSPTHKEERIQIDYESSLNKPDYSEQNIEKEKKYQTNFSPPVLTPVNISKELSNQEFIDPLAGKMISPQNDQNQNIIETRPIERESRLPFEKDEKKYRNVKI